MIELHLIVDVTAEDIAQGKRRNCGRCPLALALKRASFAMAPDRCEIEDDSAYLLLRDQRMLVADLCDDARFFVLRFDNGHSVAPERFALTLKEVG